MAKIDLIFAITGWQRLTYEADSIEEALKQYRAGMGCPPDSEIEVNEAVYNDTETALANEVTS
jgi:hypothetical protein